MSRRPFRALVLASMLTLALVTGTAAGATRGLPRHGIFVTGKTLAGVGLGFTPAQVAAHWGRRHVVCTIAPYCTAPGQPVWFYQYAVGEPLGVGVRFRNGKTAAVFTLGAVGVRPLGVGGGGGWETSKGLHITDPPSKLYSLYPEAQRETACIFYSALSMREGNVVSSFFLASGTVYGFALTYANEPICV